MAKSVVKTGGKGKCPNCKCSPCTCKNGKCVGKGCKGGKCK